MLKSARSGRSYYRLDKPNFLTGSARHKIPDNDFSPGIDFEAAAIHSCSGLWVGSPPRSFSPQRSLPVKHRAAEVNSELPAAGSRAPSHGPCPREGAEFYMLNCAHSYATRIALGTPAPPKMLRTPRIESFAPLIRAHPIRAAPPAKRRSGFGTR